MLNEIIEYKEYTDKKYAQRLDQAIINKKNGAGIRRALLIITRHELEVRNYWNEEPNKQADIRAEIIEKLKTIINDSVLNGIETSNLKDKITTWSNNNFYNPFNYDSGYSNVTATTFPRLLSEAITAGPLRNRRLVCDRQFIEDLYINDQFYRISDKSEPKVLWNKTNKGKLNTRSIPYSERLFYLISAYYIACAQYGSADGYVYLNRTDIANWMGYQAFSDNKHEEKYLLAQKQMQKLIPLFERDSREFWKLSDIFTERYKLSLENYTDKKRVVRDGDRFYIYEEEYRPDKGSKLIHHLVYPDPENYKA